MKTLIIGSNGQVGFELKKNTDYVAVDFPEIDFSEPQSIRDLITKVNPAIIINAAAYTAVDKAEEEPHLAMKINADAPAVLAEEAKKRDALLVHYSTDYVYDGKLDRPYVETDETNPLGRYALSKLRGDLAIQEINPRHLILRTSWVYGSRGKNFLLTILKLASERDFLNVIHDQRGAPTWCRDLAAATLKLIPQTLEKDIRGVFHIAGDGATTWHGFAEEICSLAQMKAQIRPITTEEYPTPAPRPKNSCLNQTKLKQTFGYQMPCWKNSVKECFKEVIL